MKRLGYFLIVGLAFTALQVATVGAEPGVGMPGGPCDPGPACVENCCPAGTVPMCGDAPCPPPTDGTGEDCAAEETPALVAACWERNRPAPGTVPMCGDAPCPPPNAP